MNNSEKARLTITKQEFSFSIGGHIEITPKYVNAKHRKEWLDMTIVRPCTVVKVWMGASKVIGEKNEIGLKRVKALLKWIKANNIQTYEVKLGNSISIDEFLAIHSK